MICTEPVNIHAVFSFFLLSWKDSEHQQINNRAMFLYLIQGQMLKFMRHFGGEKISNQKSRLA